MDERPNRIELPGRRARATTDDGIPGSVQISDYEWRYDEPPRKVEMRLPRPRLITFSGR